MGRETVSADASVLIILAKSGYLRTLRAVFEVTRVETAVERECLIGLPQRPDARAIEAASMDGGLTRATANPSDLRTLSKRHPSLGPGEIGAIAIAGRGGIDVIAGNEVEKPRPAGHRGIVLVDDGLARRVARLEGATPVGTLGVLARAHRLGVLGEREELAEALRQVLMAGLWVDASVIETFWAHIGAK